MPVFSVKIFKVSDRVNPYKETIVYAKSIDEVEQMLSPLRSSCMIEIRIDRISDDRKLQELDS